MKHSSAEKCKFSSKAKVSLSVNCNNVYGISQKHYWFCFIAHIYFDVELWPYWRNVLFGRESSFKKNERFVNAWFSFRNVDIFQNFLHNIKKWSYFSQIISSIHLRILCKANELQNIEKSITERLHLEKNGVKGWVGAPAITVLFFSTTPMRKDITTKPSDLSFGDAFPLCRIHWIRNLFTFVM